MYLNDIETTHLTKICCRNGLNPRASSLLVSYFKHLEQHRGIKFLVAYLKDVKNRLLRGSSLEKLSGQGKYFYKLYKQGRRGKRLALNICAIHGRWEAPPAKSGDYTRFARAVGLVMPKVEGFTLKFSDDDLNIMRSAIFFARFSYNPLISSSTHILSKNQKLTGPFSLGAEISALTQSGWIFEQFSDFIFQVFEVPKSARHSLMAEALYQRYLKISFVGRVVALTKDRSLKTRFIANLMKAWQVLISPCVFVFKEFLRRQEMSALLDQQGAVTWMISELKQGKKVTSVDLTQATDFLPRYLLEDALTSALPVLSSSPRSANFVQSFLLDCALNKASYWTPFDNVNVTYGTGQAMGRWTSKYLLDITMILLAKSVGGNPQNCRINGDDIFFTCEDTGDKFIKLMDQLKVPISASKTFIGKDFGEFSGVIADKYGSLEVYKASKFNVKLDPLGPLRCYGPRGLSLIPKKYQRIIWAFASLPSPYGLEKIRIKANNPYNGFLPTGNPKKFERIGWDPQWVEQAFFKYRVQSSNERLARLASKMRNRYISPSVKKEVLSLYNKEMGRNLALKKEEPLSRATRRHFKEPIQRLDLFADNLNSRDVITSDGFKIKGYGSEEFDNLQALVTSTYSHGVSRDTTGTKELAPPFPLRWVKKIYKQILKFLKRGY